MNLCFSFLVILSSLFIIQTVGYRTEVDRDFEESDISEEPASIISSEKVLEDAFHSFKRNNNDDDEEDSLQELRKLKQAVRRIVSLYKAKQLGKSEHVTNKVCTTPHCVLAAAELIKNMNTSADPCSDFHQYACGSFKKHHFLSDTANHLLSFQLLAIEIEYVMKTLMENTVKSEVTAIGKMKTFYDSCLDMESINAAGAKPLLDKLKSISTFPFQEESGSSTSYDFTAMISAIQKDTPASPLFYVGVEENVFHAAKFAIELKQSGLSMVAGFYLSNGAHEKQVFEAYKTFMLETMALLGYKSPAVRTMMLEVLEFEKSLSKIFLSKAMLRQTDKVATRIQLSEVKKIVSKVDIVSVINSILTNSGIKPVSDNYHIIVTGAKTYFQKLNQLLSTTSEKTLANYLGWMVISHSSGLLSKPFQDVITKFNAVRFGIKASLPRWKPCLSEVSAHFPIAYGLLYTKHHFDHGNVAKVSTLISTIRHEFINNLDHVQWMDYKTKEAAKEKARVMKQLIGYPVEYDDLTKLDQLYSSYKVDGLGYFANKLSLVSAGYIKNIRNLLKKKVDREEWTSTPAVVNAFYSARRNRIVLPAGILRSTFYDQNYPMALNYGGIGTVSGHEITHGFDDHGRKFDKAGDLREWWSSHSIKSFEHKADCIRKQFSTFQDYGEHVNGNVTSGENIADNGGLKMAYRALKRWEAAYGVDARLPGLNDLSSDQLFFLAYARIWCNIANKGYTIKKIISNEHSPSTFRITGALQNSQYFSDAYNCPSGSVMNPIDKCIIW